MQEERVMELTPLKLGFDETASLLIAPDSAHRRSQELFCVRSSQKLASGAVFCSPTLQGHSSIFQKLHLLNASLFSRKLTRHLLSSSLDETISQDHVEVQDALLLPERERKQSMRHRF